MKRYWAVSPFFCLAMLMGSAQGEPAGGPAPQAGHEVVRLSEPVASDAHSETFGQTIDESLPLLSLTELVENADQHVDQPVRLETRVAQVCQKKGCFIMAAEGATSLRVSFKDYGFFIPTDASGKRVQMTGTLVNKQRSAEQAEHFNADLGVTDGVPQGQVYEIVANAVRIPR